MLRHRFKQAMFLDGLQRVTRQNPLKRGAVIALKPLTIGDLQDRPILLEMFLSLGQTIYSPLPSNDPAVNSG